MWSYFRGWKRKIGVVALVGALLLTGGWIRSFRYADSVIGPADGSPCFVSTEGSIVFLANDYQYEIPYGRWHVPQVSSDDLDFAEFERALADIRWHFGQFGFGFGHDDKWKFSIWMIPYLSLVFPFTAISTWCLLTKPRQPKSGQASHAV
jgi:hypothetical protein